MMCIFRSLRTPDNSGHKRHTSCRFILEFVAVNEIRCFLQDARLGPVIARALSSDVCSRVNVALRIAVAGGQLSDFSYSL